MASFPVSQYPENLFYDLENQIWYAPLEEEVVRVGFTPVAIELAGEVLAFTPKRVGKDFEPHRSFATIECGKWIGAARAAFGGVVIAVNEELIMRPRLLNTDAFGEAWMLVVRPTRTDWSAGLVTGSAVAGAFATWKKSEAYKDRSG